MLKNVVEISGTLHYGISHNHIVGLVRKTSIAIVMNIIHNNMPVDTEKVIREVKLSTTDNWAADSQL